MGGDEPGRVDAAPGGGPATGGIQVHRVSLVLGGPAQGGQAQQRHPENPGQRGARETGRGGLRKYFLNFCLFCQGAARPLRAS